MIEPVFTVPSSYFVGGAHHESITADEAYEPRSRFYDTGLITLQGRKIYRERATVPFGFVGSVS